MNSETYQRESIIGQDLLPAAIASNPKSNEIVVVDDFFNLMEGVMPPTTNKPAISRLAKVHLK